MERLIPYSNTCIHLTVISVEKGKVASLLNPGILRNRGEKFS